MKIIKYEKKGNGNYKIYLENNQSINIHENVILKNNLLYKNKKFYIEQGAKLLKEAQSCANCKHEK